MNHRKTKSKEVKVHTWRKRLLQLVSLLRVKHTKSIEVLGAANLELHHIFASLDLDRTGILPSCCKKEILDLMNLLRLFMEKQSIVTITKLLQNSIIGSYKSSIRCWINEKAYNQNQKIKNTIRRKAKCLISK